LAGHRHTFCQKQQSGFWLAVWATPQGIERGGQPTSVGGTGQPNKPINANWQAGFLLGLVVAREIFKIAACRCSPCQSRYRRSLAAIGKVLSGNLNK